MQRLIPIALMALSLAGLVALVYEQIVWASATTILTLFLLGTDQVLVHRGRAKRASGGPLGVMTEEEQARRREKILKYDF